MVEGDAFEAGNLIICEPSLLNLLIFFLCLDVHLANPFSRNFWIQEILLIVECPLVLLAFAFLPEICQGRGLGISLQLLQLLVHRDSGILALSILGHRLASFLRLLCLDWLLRRLFFLDQDKLRHTTCLSWLSFACFVGEAFWGEAATAAGFFILDELGVTPQAKETAKEQNLSQKRLQQNPNLRKATKNGNF